MRTDILPTIELEANQSDKFKFKVYKAFEKYGAFHLQAPGMVANGESLLVHTRSLFALDESEKLKYKLDRRTIHSGYSLLKNERDYREQYHLFSGFLNDSTATNPASGLKRPNKAPQSLGASWMRSVDRYMDSMAELSRLILKGLFDDYGVLANSSSNGDNSYNLLKMIHYLNHLDSDRNKTGTPPHVDWSLVTIVMQDKKPGLSILVGDDWIEVERKDDCFIVIAGELLEIATRSQFIACPHRVILSESVKHRFAAPFFFCPNLDKALPILPVGDTDRCDSNKNHVSSSNEDLHVHRVFKRGEVCGDFHFGATELNRKQYGRWCFCRSCCW